MSTVLRNPEFHKIWKREEQYIGNTDPIVPINIEAKGETLSWKVILSTFGTPRNVSLDEYQMEFFYPADQHTSEFAHRFFLDS